MGLTLVDANHVLRWFLNDVPAQAEVANKLITTSAAGSLVIDRVTLAEITYVLRGKGYDHGQVHALCEELFYYPSLQAMEPIELRALELFRGTTLDFEDCVLVAAARHLGYAVATFDKKLLTVVRHR